VGAIRLDGMQPGENRWVGVSLNAPVGEKGQVLPVYFYEIVAGRPVNGFAVGVRLASLEDTARANLQLHRSVFARVLAGHRIKEADPEVNAALKLLKPEAIAVEAYVTFLSSRLESVKRIVAEVIKAVGGTDSFAVQAGFDSLAAAVATGNAESAAVAHTRFLNRLDAALTQHQLTKGDVADILQNVRWQELLYKTRDLPELKCARKITALSHDFIVAYGMRKVTNEDYPGLLRRCISCFAETAENPGTRELDLKQRLISIEKSFGDLRALQKAHRAFLLELDTIKEKQ